MCKQTVKELVPNTKYSNKTTIKVFPVKDNSVMRLPNKTELQQRGHDVNTTQFHDKEWFAVTNKKRNKKKVTYGEAVQGNAAGHSLPVWTVWSHIGKLSIGTTNEDLNKHLRKIKEQIVDAKKWSRGVLIRTLTFFQGARRYYRRVQTGTSGTSHTVTEEIEALLGDDDTPY